MKNNINGILVVNKPTGMTSRDVVNHLSKKFGTKKIGHTGTLDPIASGVLVCVFGKYTRLSELITSDIKKYKASFILGIDTDTLDITGNVLHKGNDDIDSNKIIETIKSFKKTYDQEVPKYSAVKINGKKLYEYARNNIEVTLPKRKVTIYSIDDIKIDKTISFECTVSKGTYIRSLIRDIGRSLNTYAVMTSLIRTKQGNFDIKDAYTLEDIDNENYKFLSIEDIIPKEDIIEIDKDMFKKVTNGVRINLKKDSKVVLFRYENKNVCLYKKCDDYYSMLVKLI